MLIYSHREHIGHFKGEKHMTQGKSYTVKEWFANKVAEEVKKNISMCDVFAIIKESEKAAYCVLNLGANFHKTMWVPKSVMIENKVGQTESGKVNYETLVTDNYDEAIEKFKIFWAQFN